MRTLPIPAVRPTQTHLSAAKLAGVVDWFDFDEPNYGSLPAFVHEGEWYLSDGHTRGAVAALAGAETLTVERDPSVREEYDFDVYLAAIGWCDADGIDTVRDLHGRVVSADTYESVWIDRCRSVAEE